MKKLGLLLLAFVLVSTAQAQMPLSLGLKFGYNSSKMTLSNFQSTDYKFSDIKSETKNGYNLGAMARIKLGKLFLQPEAYYTVKKGATSLKPTLTGGLGGLTPGVNYSKEVSLQNLEIPILLGYKLLDFKLANLHVMTGPMAAFNMGNDVKFTNADGEKVSSDDFLPSGGEFTSFSSAMKAAQWNWQFGAGVDILMLTIDARYEMGLSNLSKMDLTEKSNFLIFSVAWRFFG